MGLREGRTEGVRERKINYYQETIDYVGKIETKPNGGKMRGGISCIPPKSVSMSVKPLASLTKRVSGGCGDREKMDEELDDIYSIEETSPSYRNEFMGHGGKGSRI